jgi:NAD(P)-dependent dehydrogenase (short-subunit alcohol dehydrogenase family)
VLAARHPVTIMHRPPGEDAFVDLELEGKVVLVTGGSDGLGAALCRRLGTEGARVAFCARDPERLEAAAGRLRDAGAEVLAVRADVSQAAEVEEFVDAAHSRWGRVDALVNNAGTSHAEPFESITDEDLERDLQLKLFAAVRACRLVMPHLRAAGGGAIVNVLNVGAKAPRPASIPTVLSRGAGLSLTKVLSKEFGGEGVRVNAVMVGLIESGQWVRQAAARQVPVTDLYDQMGRESGIPLGRVGKAEEFADLVAFLVSPRASYVSGTAVNIDGGLCATV